MTFSANDQVKQASKEEEPGLDLPNVKPTYENASYNDLMIFHQQGYKEVEK